MADPDPGAEFWTVVEVASYLGVQPGTVRSYHSRHQMPPPDRRYGRTDLWRPTTITSWNAGRNPRSDRNPTRRRTSP